MCLARLNATGCVHRHCLRTLAFLLIYLAACQGGTAMRIASVGPARLHLPVAATNLLTIHVAVDRHYTHSAQLVGPHSGTTLAILPNPLSKDARRPSWPSIKSVWNSKQQRINNNQQQYHWHLKLETEGAAKCREAQKFFAQTQRSTNALTHTQT